MFSPILITLIIFGVWISYEDIKKRKIRNYSLALLFLSAVFINIFLTKSFIQLPLFSFLNIAFGVGMAFLIWWAGFWPAADAKLFIVINSLFPISFYLGNNTYFPGMVILINSGLILFLVLIVQIIAKTTLKEKINLFLKQAKPSVFFKIFLIVWAMYFINLFIFPILGIRKEYLIWLLCLLFVFWFFEQKIKVNIFYIVAGIIFFSLFAPFLLNIDFFTIDFFFVVLLLSIAIFVMHALISLSFSSFTKSVSLKELQEGMIPAEMIVKENGCFVKRPIVFSTLLSTLRQKNKYKALIGFDTEGLQKKEISKIQFLAKQGLLNFNNLRVAITFPFAPFLFGGAFLTYFLNILR